MAWHGMQASNFVLKRPYIRHKLPQHSASPGKPLPVAGQPGAVTAAAVAAATPHPAHASHPAPYLPSADSMSSIMTMASVSQDFGQDSPAAIDAQHQASSHHHHHDSAVASYEELEVRAVDFGCTMTLSECVRGGRRVGTPVYM